MKLRNKEGWETAIKNNPDPYGGCCINVARRVMELLDDAREIDACGLIHQANKELDARITGFMAGAVASMVSAFHERGDDFKKSWNKSF